MATQHCVICVETPESRTQVQMRTGGVLKVYDNVTFEANSARSGGAVSPPPDIGLHLNIVLFCDRFFYCGFDARRQLTSLLWKGCWFRSNHAGQSLATRRCVLCVETPESRTQVYMWKEGMLEVHDNVVFKANTADIYHGGAVSPPFETV